MLLGSVLFESFHRYTPQVELKTAVNWKPISITGCTKHHTGRRVSRQGLPVLLGCHGKRSLDESTDVCSVGLDSRGGIPPSIDVFRQGRCENSLSREEMDSWVQVLALQLSDRKPTTQHVEILEAPSPFGSLVWKKESAWSQLIVRG